MSRTPTFNTFGARLRAAREAAGLSRAELARRLERAGVRLDGHTIYRWERGMAAPRTEAMLAAMAKALDTTPAWLRYGVVARADRRDCCAGR